MKLKNNGDGLTKKDVMNKVIPIENEEHFEYVTEVLKELGCKAWADKYQYYGYEMVTGCTQKLVVDSDFDILGCYGAYPDGFTLLEIPLPSPQQTLPEKFKLSCGDKPEVRQWLKDLGYTWMNGWSLTRQVLEAKYMIYNCNHGGFTWYASERDYENMSPDYSEITPVFSEREVTITEPYVSGFEVAGSSDKAKVEELVEKLQKQLEEAKQELSKLKLEEK